MAVSRRPRVRLWIRALAAAGVGAAAGIGAAVVVVADSGGTGAAGEAPWGLLLYGVPIGICVGALAGSGIWALIRVIIGVTRTSVPQVRLVAAGIVGAVLPATVFSASFRSDDGRPVAALLAGGALGLAGTVAEWQAGRVGRGGKRRELS